MGRTQTDLARNLIQTLGAQRAAHVARQYCWYGVADEIARMNGQVTADAAGDLRASTAGTPAPHFPQRR
jgi:hypothetical protein